MFSAGRPARLSSGYDTSMHLLSVGAAFPAHYYSQTQLIEAFAEAWGREHHNVDRVRRLHEAVMVGGRHLALPMEAYDALRGFTDANTAFLEVGTSVGAEALARALTQAQLRHDDVDMMTSVSVTGIGTPSIDARLVHRTELRDDLKRVPIFGLGCVAGAAGVARLHDYLVGHPDEVAVLLSVELCSLTLQRRDLSAANLIASGLFGDGAAAVVAVGDARAKALDVRGPRVVASGRRIYPDSERVMGWDIGDSGFRIVLDKSVPNVVRQYLRDDIDGFLARHDLCRSDIARWICHPGGPKVLDAFQECLALPDGALDLTWQSLKEVGNLSSASVLMVLRQHLAAPPPPGSWGLMIAMGPGFCSELVLLRW